MVRMKECYPLKLNITRDDANALISSESDKAAFYECKTKFRESFLVSNELFKVRGLTNAISNSIDLYESNNTLYIVSTYLEGEALSYDTFSSLQKCISIVKSTAGAIKKIHDSGYMYLDVKPDNIYVLNGTTEIVQLFDFDSLIPISSERERDAFTIRWLIIIRTDIRIWGRLF